MGELADRRNHQLYLRQKLVRSIEDTKFKFRLSCGCPKNRATFVVEIDIVPATKSLQEILHISNEESKKQETDPYDSHREKNFPLKVARNLIPGQGANLLCKDSQDGFVSRKK